MKTPQEQYINEIDKLLDCRAGKLLKKRKRFIVVAVDEHYFMKVYNIIQKYERKKGTWTDDCQDEYDKSYLEWMERVVKCR